ncbi:hypothetical protein F8M49_29320 [Rhodococcus zopfii]|uniref:Transmembrane protein n=1 Tax=Rhodococcus zopfii TaxID=43772 RepID=A0ABU3WWW0_9NOCA|nr:hypothetical protein [Rhodococcus zopfii]MDV2478491.1 hypothetical protein [Rhodococcus zopfii]
MVRPVSLRSVVPVVYSLALAVAVLGPLVFSPGYLLLRDAVSTPRSFPTDSALGITDAAARAVPQDALLAVVTVVVDGGVAVTVLLMAALWAAGWGAARLVATLLPGRTSGLPAQLVAATVAVWNPYVAERLLQGHWSLLVGYAALPWVVCATVAVRGGQRGGWWALAAWLAAAGLTPTGAVLAAITALALLAAPGGTTWRWPRIAGGTALSVVASMPWLVATAVSGGGSDADPAGVAAFAARAEPLLGTLGSLAGLGGIWNADAVPGSRATPWALVGTVALLIVVACGLPALWRRREPVTVTLAVLAVVAVLAPALAATAVGLRAGEWSMLHVPGAGLLRDTQKWVALALPLYVLSAGAGIGGLRARFGGRDAVWATAAVLVVLVATPDLVWGVGGRVRPVQYPAGWRQVAGIVTADDGDVAVLPAGMFRRFEYSGRAAVLDPAPRMLRADVLQTGQLVVAGGAVAGEGRRAADVETLLLAGADPGELAARGVGWVLVEHGTPGELGESQRTLDGLERVHGDAELSLYRVPGASRQPADRDAAVAAHVLWALLLGGGAAGGLAVRLRGQARAAREQT